MVDGPWQKDRVVMSANAGVGRFATGGATKEPSHAAPRVAVVPEEVVGDELPAQSKASAACAGVRPVSARLASF